MTRTPPVPQSGRAAAAIVRGGRRGSTPAPRTRRRRPSRPPARPPTGPASPATSPGELLLELLQRSHARRQPGLLRQHDREPVPDRERHAAHLGHEPVAVLAEPAERDRAPQDVQQVGRDGVRSGGGRGRRESSGQVLGSAADCPQTIQRVGQQQQADPGRPARPVGRDGVQQRVGQRARRPTGGRTPAAPTGRRWRGPARSRSGGTGPPGHAGPHGGVAAQHGVVGRRVQDHQLVEPVRLGVVRRRRPQKRAAGLLSVRRAGGTPRRPRGRDRQRRPDGGRRRGAVRRP